jgi:hypothetical protein
MSAAYFLDLIEWVGLFFYFFFWVKGRGQAPKRNKLNNYNMRPRVAGKPDGRLSHPKFIRVPNMGKAISSNITLPVDMINAAIPKNYL